MPSKKPKVAITIILVTLITTTFIISQWCRQQIYIQQQSYRKKIIPIEPKPINTSPLQPYKVQYKSQSDITYTFDITPNSTDKEFTLNLKANSDYKGIIGVYLQNSYATIEPPKEFYLTSNENFNIFNSDTKSLQFYTYLNKNGYIGDDITLTWVRSDQLYITSSTWDIQAITFDLISLTVLDQFILKVNEVNDKGKSIPFYKTSLSGNWEISKCVDKSNITMSANIINLIKPYYKNPIPAIIDDFSNYKINAYCPYMRTEDNKIIPVFASNLIGITMKDLTTLYFFPSSKGYIYHGQSSFNDDELLPIVDPTSF